MKHLLRDRRLFLAVFAIACLTTLAIVHRADVAGAVATIVLAVSGANAAQAVGVAQVSRKPEKEE